MVNPYEPPQTDEPDATVPRHSPTNNGKRLVRSILFVHLAVVLGFAALLNLLPRGSIPASMASDFSVLAAAFSVLSIFGFPVFLLVAIGTSSMPTGNKFMAAIAEALIVCGQLWMLLPAVQ